MPSVVHIRAVLIEIKRFTESTSTSLHCMSGGLGENLDLVEFGEGLVLLREAMAELETIANAAADLRIKLWERLEAEGIS